jgi:hypothetical protein
MMQIREQMTTQAEFKWWVVLLVVGLALALVFAGILGGTG